MCVFHFFIKIGMLGKSQFPLIQGPTPETSRFYGVGQVRTTLSPVPGQTYKSVGDQAKVKVNDICNGDLNAMLAIVSAFELAVLLGNIEHGENLFITLDVPGKQTPKLGGCSEGLAVTMAVLGYKVPEDVMMTGFVDVFGDRVVTLEDMMNLPVKYVEGIPAKIQGAVQQNMTLIIPRERTSNIKLGPKVVRVNTLGEVIRFLFPNGNH